MSFWKWSRTAATNATADGTINWAEGQAPSSVNDSARAMMAAAAKYRDDISGAIVTGGTSTAYTVTTYEVYSTLALMDGSLIAFSPHATNGATVTLAVDGLAAKPLRLSPSVELTAGILVQGTPYTCLYNNANAEFYLHSLAGAVNPYSIPLGGIIPFAGGTAPNSSFVLPYGQAINRTTYAGLFALTSTTFGTGDGSTTFNVPDLRGRLPTGKDDMGGSAASRFGSVVTDNGTIVGITLGSVGGSTSHILTTSEMPTHTHTVTDPGHQHNIGTFHTITGTGIAGGTGAAEATAATNSNTTGITNQNAGSSSAHAIVQPTIILNYLLRVL